MNAKLNVYEIDPAHSSASFSVKHMMISKVKGGFTNLSGKLTMDWDNPARSSIEATIDAASIDTHEPKRDEHLKSPDFFDVQKYPRLEFKSTSFKQSGEERFKVVGALTIHGVTREVVLDVEASPTEMKDPWGNIKIGASAAATIKRKEFGLTWNAALEAGGVLVGDDIAISLELQFVKKG